MELGVLERLRAEFDTTEKQQVQVAKRIGEFGSKKLEDTKVTKPHPKPKRPGQTITETMSGAKTEILDIMCLAQLLFDGGNENVAAQLRIQILHLGISFAHDHDIFVPGHGGSGPVHRQQNCPFNDKIARPIMKFPVQ